MNFMLAVLSTFFPPTVVNKLVKKQRQSFETLNTLAKRFYFLVWETLVDQ